MNRRTHQVLLALEGNDISLHRHLNLSISDQYEHQRTAWEFWSIFLSYKAMKSLDFIRYPLEEIKMTARLLQTFQMQGIEDRSTPRLHVFEIWRTQSSMQQTRLWAHATHSPWGFQLRKLARGTFRRSFWNLSLATSASTDLWSTSTSKASMSSGDW